MAVAIKAGHADLYRPKANQPEIVNVPDMQFVMIDGAGDPNQSTDYQQTIEALYSVAYGLKFMLKKRDGIEFRVAPLEGLWWALDMTVFNLEQKDAYHWTMMISLPDEVTLDAFKQARDEARRRRPSQALERVRLARFHEGQCAQVMHIGPYSTEGPTIARLHAFIREHGYTFDGTKQKHHEIYLGDPRRAAPEKLKTVIRQPFSRR